MQSTLKNVVAVALTIALITLSVSAGYYVYYYSKSQQPTSYRSFSVTSEAKVTASPDIARFSYSVITEGGTNLEQLQASNTEKVNRTINFLKETGIPDEDITTIDYSVMPRYQYFNCTPEGVCPPSEIVGYTVSQTVSVKVREFEKIGALLSGVIKQGANSVSQLSFAIDEPFELQNQARIKAIEQARMKAEEIAQAGGFQVGRLLSIEEGYVTPPIFARDLGIKEGYGGGAPAAPSPSIEPGSQDVSATVTLRYEIK